MCCAIVNGQLSESYWKLFSAYFPNDWAKCVHKWRIKFISPLKMVLKWPVGWSIVCVLILNTTKIWFVDQSPKKIIKKNTVWSFQRKRDHFNWSLAVCMTCATVCSPNGMSSPFKATRCTTAIGSASRMILKEKGMKWNLQTFQTLASHCFSPSITNFIDGQNDDVQIVD